MGQQPRIVATPISNELLTLYKTVAEQVTAAGPLFSATSSSCRT